MTAGETAPKKYGDAMENGDGSNSLSRRQLLQMIGSSAGGAAMYHAMSSLGFAAESPCIATLIGAMTTAVMIRQIHNPGRIRKPRAVK